MGWASGSRVMSAIIDGMQDVVQDVELRKKIYAPIIDALEDSDWDTQDECMGEDPAYDAVIKELHPTWYEDEGDDADSE